MSITPRKQIYTHALGYLQRHPGEQFTATQLAPLLHFDRGPIQTALSRSLQNDLLGCREHLRREEGRRFDPAWWWQPDEHANGNGAHPTAAPADWSERHAASQHIMQFFSYDHLPAGPLRETSTMCAELAELILSVLPDGPELSAGMRKLLEAKDCFVRAALLAKDDGASS